MPDFTHRSSGREIMDDLQASGKDLNQALQELESINYLLGGNYVTLTGLTQLLNGKSPAEGHHIVDIGCGSGDILKLARRLLTKRNVEARLTGIDANPNVIDFARSHTPSECRIQYESLNIFSEEFRSRSFDILVGTLFFHHFNDADLVRLFKQLKTQVSTGMVINDIHRHWFSYYAIKWLTRFFSRSTMVKHDAPLSVLRAFKKRELKEILGRAGIENYRIKWCWAFRWQVVVRF
jgi:2-polyprenyl-3-methyl-5-hydroxy-6-metoxy-1,4-benzoquinol methylase